MKNHTKLIKALIMGHNLSCITMTQLTAMKNEEEDERTVK
jgi:hypothetical protein